MLSYRADKQVITARTDKLTDTQTDAGTIPEGQNWPQVKNMVKNSKGNENENSNIKMSSLLVGIVIFGSAITSKSYEAREKTRNASLTLSTEFGDTWNVLNTWASEIILTFEWYKFLQLFQFVNDKIWRQQNFVKFMMQWVLHVQYLHNFSFDSAARRAWQCCI